MTNITIRADEKCVITLCLVDDLGNLEQLRDLGVPKCRRLIRLLFVDHWRNEVAIDAFAGWLDYIVPEAQRAYTNAKDVNAKGRRTVPRGTKREAATRIRAENKRLKYEEDNARRNKDFAVKLQEMFRAEEAF